MTIEDYIQSRDCSPNLKSHLYGVMQTCGYNGASHDILIDNSEMMTLYGSLQSYLGGSPVKTHTLHGGKNQIRLSQFVDSVVEAYTNV